MTLCQCKIEDPMWKSRTKHEEGIQWALLQVEAGIYYLAPPLKCAEYIFMHAFLKYAVYLNAV